MGIHSLETLQARKEKKMKYWFTALKDRQRCSACGEQIEAGKKVLAFKYLSKQNLSGNHGRVYICHSCMIELEQILKEGKSDIKDM